MHLFAALTQAGLKKHKTTSGTLQNPYPFQKGLNVAIFTVKKFNFK